MNFNHFLMNSFLFFKYKSRILFLEEFEDLNSNICGLTEGACGRLSVININSQILNFAFTLRDLNSC